tara:strand:- start:3631 stop:3813 length:183 start_codon:yes stop_codon:yes gene_type:complete
MLEGFALGNAMFEVQGLTPGMTILMFTMFHNVHFYLMIKYVPKEHWPEKLLLIDVKREGL